MPAVGGIDAVKSDLKTYIEAASSQLTDKVFGNWRLGIEKIYKPRSGLQLPAVTIRISPLTVRDMTYTRKVPESGSMETVAFTAHVFHSACNISGQEKYKHAHDIADIIMTYLESIDWNTGSYADSSIVDIYDMSARESEPSKGPRRTCRVIIEGMILSKREDA